MKFRVGQLVEWRHTQRGARLEQALAMLWQHYLLPISDEQKRQVEEALAGLDTPAEGGS